MRAPAILTGSISGRFSQQIFSRIVDSFGFPKLSMTNAISSIILYCTIYQAHKWFHLQEKEKALLQGLYRWQDKYLVRARIFDMAEYG